MEKYEQYKMLSYLLTALQNNNFFKEHLSDIYDWHDSYGQNIIKFSWVSKSEEAKGNDFYLQPNEHASEMLERFLSEKELEEDAGLHK